MRQGFNPKKDKVLQKGDFFHQIVIPVYIPNHQDYFKDSFQILKLCLESLFRTIHSKTYVSIVNNGSCEDVKLYLNALYDCGKIHELVTTSNIGYINAMLKGIAGQNFQFFTTADADVLFLNGWQESTYSIFSSFPRAGAVCPTPSPKSLRTHTANIYWDLLFSNKLKFSKVLNKDALLKFASSIDNSDFYNEFQLKKYLTISSGKVKAVVGAGHFVVTYKASIFENLKKRYTNFVLGGNSDNLFDIPVVEKGYWRLSTENNYAYHLGNIHEEWMDLELKSITENKFEPKEEKYFEICHYSNFSYWIKNKFFAKIFFKKYFFRRFLLLKGLSVEAAKKYN
ncbi:MAG TPA: glycosyltransferase [Flavobacterium sp.]|jgi:hypothetical protein